MKISEILLGNSKLNNFVVNIADLSFKSTQREGHTNTDEETNLEKFVWEARGV